MARLSVRRLDDEVVRRLKIRAARDAVSLEETVRRILGTAVVDEEPVGTMGFGNCMIGQSFFRTLLVSIPESIPHQVRHSWNLP